MHVKILYLILSYFLGAVPFGYLLVKTLKGIDIRKLGSGNIGATNVFRYDKKLGILTLLFDTAKSFFPTLLATKFFSFNFAILVAFASILGHITSPFLNFRGGKGVATAFGAYLALTPYPVFIALISFITFLLLFRIVSLSSLIASLVWLLIIVFIEDYPLYFDVISLMTVLVIYIAHLSNIKRLLEGTEKKINF
ncbi:MAG: glycerol-3-phosphate 1-O-acyltransferase PlsY [Candidatus Hydrothermales bacterium]